MDETIKPVEPDRPDERAPAEERNIITHLEKTSEAPTAEREVPEFTRPLGAQPQAESHYLGDFFDDPGPDPVDELDAYLRAHLGLADDVDFDPFDGAIQTIVRYEAEIKELSRLVAEARKLVSRRKVSDGVLSAQIRKLFTQ